MPVAWWSLWELTPFVSVLTAFSLWLYVRGIGQASGWQRVGFFFGTALLFLALQSPLDALSDDSFAVHQAQHLILHMFGPMFVALSAPAAALLAGMPRWLRREVYAPIAAAGPVRSVFAFLSRPAVAAAHFIAAMLFWLQPAIYDRAVADGALHELMHWSMLIAGLFFYSCVFDPRSPPTGCRYGARVFMLLAALFVNIPLGAYLSDKQTLLYRVYSDAPRLGLSPIGDEQLGALLQYVPGSMMFVIAILLVLAFWYRHEARLHGWRSRGLSAAHALDASASAPLAKRNARLGLILAGVGLFMFAAAIVSGVLVHLAGRS